MDKAVKAEFDNVNVNVNHTYRVGTVTMDNGRVVIDGWSISFIPFRRSLFVPGSELEQFFSLAKNQRMVKQNARYVRATAFLRKITKPFRNLWFRLRGGIIVTH